MNVKNRLKRFFYVFIFSLSAFAAVISACDMVRIEYPSPDGSDLSEQERNELEKSGRFLKLTNMPLNTQVTNVFSVSVANSLSPVARLNPKSKIRIFRETDSSTAYLPLVYNDDSEFTETGFFYTAFSVHVDAVSKFIVNVSDRLLVPYTDGRGEVDVNNLPSAESGGSRELTSKERDELEKSGRFLKLTNMPLNTQVPNVFSVAVANSSSAVGKLNKDDLISIFRDAGSCTVYLPLVYNDGSGFLETGSFYTAFSVHVDAVTKFVVEISDRLLVPYVDGRGEVDVNNLPVSGQGGGRELNPKERDELEKSGRFLKLTNMPANTQIPNVVSVTIANSASGIASLNKNDNIKIFRDDVSSCVYLPLAYNNDSEFTETGVFFVAFTVHVDAVSSYILTLNDKFLVSFSDGRGSLDIRSLPYRGISAPESHYLNIYNLPLFVLPQNVSGVTVHNQSGAIAQCPDYSLIETASNGTSSTVSIPLVFSGSSSPFTGTGSFYVAFDISVDALTRFKVSVSDCVIVSFTNGNGFLNINDLPLTAGADHRFLTVLNLPSNFSSRNISGVYVYNQAGRVAECQDYDLLDVASDNNSCFVRIPLCYSGSKSSFLETGNYFVALDINIDADTRFRVTLDDRVPVSFTAGNGSLDINNIPEKTVPCLVIKSLPLNTSKHQISNVSVYSLSGVIASCSNYNDIVITKDSSYATAVIPLFHSSVNDYFRDNGSFRVTFTVTVDLYTQISYTQNDNLVLQFVAGSSSFDLLQSFGFFEGALVNQDNNLPPEIKKGTSFELNGFVKNINADTKIDLVVPSAPCVFYIYAYTIGNDLFFEGSSQTPSFIAGKNGYYSGGKRALWKMIYLQDGSDLFLFKTYVADGWPHLKYHTVGSFTSSFTPYYSLSGSSNPAPVPVTLSPGAYIIKLTAAGGGGGFGSLSNNVTSGSSLGGQGGTVTEVLVLKSSVTFSVFTGSGGTAGSKPSVTGNFSYFTCNTPTSPYYLSTSLGPCSGGSGGGGGSGSFVYYDQGYLLSAGGGGGGSGGSYVTPGGAGGAGGSCGPGSGGGASGYFYRTYASGSSGYTFTVNSGNAGGYMAGSGGNASTRTGSDGVSFVTQNLFGFSGSAQTAYDGSLLSNSYVPNYVWAALPGGAGGSAAYLNNAFLPVWLTTNSANGQGANAPALNPIDTSTTNSGGRTVTTFKPGAPVNGVNGSLGGNNRNSSKGGGSPGGPVIEGLPGDGSEGSVIIYKIQ
jgi:hypothetical protein